jgi:hypothetical protein
VSLQKDWRRTLENNGDNTWVTFYHDNLVDILKFSDEQEFKALIKVVDVL